MDLKIRDVAELLNISETTIRRWLAEGKLPAYKLNRQYRFNRSEIEDWVLQQKLGLGKEKEERVARSQGGGQHFSLYRAMHRGIVLPKVHLRAKEEIIAHTMQHMAQNFDLDAEVLTDLFLDREKLMPTSLSNGIGVPHTRDFLLNTHFDVIVTVFPETPIEYGALDGKPVHTLFFLFACDDKRHLHLLAKLAHLSSQEKATSFLRTQPTKETLLDYIRAWENTLDGTN